MVATLFNFYKDKATDAPAIKRVGSEKVLADALFGKPLFGRTPIIYVPLEVHSDKPAITSSQTPKRPDENDKAQFHQYMVENLYLG